MFITTKIKRDEVTVDCDHREKCDKEEVDKKCKSCKHCKDYSVKTSKYVFKELLFEDLGWKGKVLRIFLYILLILLVVMPFTVIFYIVSWIFS